MMMAAALRNCCFLESNDLIEKGRNSAENGGLRKPQNFPISEWLRVVWRFG